MNKMAGLNGKRRGQAFETMMLVISVIVAVAILGVLLGFLGNIGFNVANAKTVIPDLIKKVSNEGFGTESKDNVDFAKDDTIYIENLISGSSVPASKLHVCIGDEIKDALEFKTASKPEDAYINVKSGVKAAIAVCKGKGIDVRIAIRDTKANAMSVCAPSDATKTSASC